MSEGKNHSELFKKYLKGEMTSQEAHAFERASLDDPFTQEALEGFENQGIEHLDELDALRSKVRRKKKGYAGWLRYASAAAVILVGLFSVYFFVGQFDQTPALATSEESLDHESSSQPSADTLLVPGSASGLAEMEAPNVEEFKNEQQAYEERPVLDREEEAEVVENFFAEVSIEDEENVAPQMATEALSKEADLTSELADVGGSSTQIDEPEASSVLYQEEEAASFAVKEDAPLVNAKTKKSVARSAGAVSRSAAVETPLLVGTVTNEFGEPLPGVNILIAGTTTGTITDVDGNYFVPRLDSDFSLVYSFVGYETLKMDVGNRDTLDVTLGGSASLQEVVVVAYGENDQLYDNTYAPAKPVNGGKAYKKYLEENLRYPLPAKENAINGTVVLELTISSDGSIRDISIKKSLGHGCDEEAIRLVQEGPGWEPAARNGVSVEDRIKVKVKFK